MKSCRSRKKLKDEFHHAATYHCEMKYASAIICLHREWGWGQERCRKLLDGILEAWQECAHNINASALTMLRDETGIELKPSATCRSFEEIPCLNGETMLGRDLTPGQYVYYRKQLVAWIPYTLLAIMFLTLHRQHGFSDVRLTRLMEQMEAYKDYKPEELKQIVKDELRINLENYTEGVE